MGGYLCLSTISESSFKRLPAEIITTRSPGRIISSPVGIIDFLPRIIPATSIFGLVGSSLNGIFIMLQSALTLNSSASGIAVHKLVKRFHLTAERVFKCPCILHSNICYRFHRGSNSVYSESGSRARKFGAVYFGNYLRYILLQCKIRKQYVFFIKTRKRRKGVNTANALFKQ